MYSLAVVAYELLAGAPPYRLARGSAAELEEVIASVDPPLASEATLDPAARKHLRGDLDAILNKALRKDPAERYPSVLAFADDIQRHLAQMPVLAQPDSVAYRARKFVLRHRLETAIAAALIVALIGGAYAQVVVAAALVAGAAVASWQARAARLQARLARQQAARAEETKRFVLSFFEAGDADHGANHKTTAVDLLKKARERLDTAAIAEDAIRAELLATIGAGLSGLGELDDARTVLSEAVHLGSKTLGESSEVTAPTRALYGFVLLNLGEATLAATQLEAAEHSIRRSNDTRALSSVLRGGSALAYDEGRYQLAIDLARDAVHAAEQQTDKVELIAACMRLSASMLAATRPGSLEPAQRAYAVARELYKDRPTSGFLLARVTLLAALADNGDAASVLNEMSLCRRQQVDLFGADNVQVAITWGRLGGLHWRLGDLDSTLLSFREALRIYSLKSAGKATTAMAITRSRLANVLVHAYRCDEGLEEWNRANEIYSAVFGNEHGTARLARAGAASALIKLHRLNEADRILGRLLERPCSSVSEERTIMARLALLRSAQGRHDDANGLLAGISASFLDGPLEQQRALSPAELGHAMIAQGRFEDALKTLNEARSWLLSRFPNGAPDLAEVAVDLARAELALGRAGDAVVSAEEACAFWTRFDPSSRGAGIACLWHACALHALGKPSQAGDGLRRAAAVLAVTGLEPERALLEETRGSWMTCNADPDLSRVEYGP